MNRKIIAYLFLILFTSPAHAAIEWDISDGRLSCGSAASLTDLWPVTISAWIKPYTTGQSGNGCIVGKGNSTTTGGGWRFRTAGINRIGFEKDFDGVTNLSSYAPNDSIKLNQWHHIAFTWDGTATASTGVFFFINGSEQPRSTDNNGAGSPVTDSGVAMNVGDIPSSGATFDGQISEVAIWRRILTDGQIKQLSFRIGGEKNTLGVKGLPLAIEKDALVFYLPMNEAPNLDMVGAARDFSGTNNHCTSSAQIISVADGIVSYP